MRTSLSLTLLALALLLGLSVSVLADVDVQIVGSYGGAHSGGDGDGYGGSGEDNDGDNDGGGYGGGYGHGHKRMGDVETFLKIRNLLLAAANNSIAFIQLAALNEFNTEVLSFPYSFPGTLSLSVRELEKVSPYNKYDTLLKKPARSMDIVHDMK